VLNITWVNIGNIHMDKINEKNASYVGSLVGVTPEFDMATLHRPESARLNVGYRYAENISNVIEGV
jgi:hypothetical protein